MRSESARFPVSCHQFLCLIIKSHYFVKNTYNFEYYKYSNNSLTGCENSKNSGTVRHLMHTALRDTYVSTSARYACASIFECWKHLFTIANAVPVEAPTLFFGDCPEMLADATLWF